MDINDLVYEVPKEKLNLDEQDIVFLELLKEKYKDQVNNIIPHRNNYVMKSGYTQWYVKDATAEEKSHPVFLKFVELFKYTSHNTLEKIINSCKIARIPGPLNIHVDYRAAILSIPLVDLVKPITFWSSRNDDKTILNQYYYTKYKPVIKNVHVEHNVIDNNEDRIIFQVGSFGKENNEDFKNLIKKL